MKSFGDADYYGVTVSVNTGWLITGAGLVAMRADPRVGAVLAGVGQAVAKAPASVGGGLEWDRYGDVWIIFPNAAVGKTPGSIPASGDFFAGWINPDFTPATPRQVRDFCSGWSVSVSGGPLVGKGTTGSWTGELGVENHIMFPPQVSIGFSYGNPVYITQFTQAIHGR